MVFGLWMGALELGSFSVSVMAGAFAITARAAAAVKIQVFRRDRAPPGCGTGYCKLSTSPSLAGTTANGFGTPHALDAVCLYAP